ncbi:preprotein translocase subunit SecG [Shewanella eurypsychrophilus]|uniref:Protein-export membrane protein SecG n=1 Tax=Shewanella eurypsychrophilus TaxID=2593656 RepID=A0ABX6V976_9GAMM|nr:MULTISPECIES: preprotein translocase subunit SecG [Shewanella]QFU23961.1 preprotein translocase subunit SecG [Shewanella sp. YLB-09]QPG59177.1 preprotein translocase subunit SecG [Shewanella eurypsychrophilus]
MYEVLMVVYLLVAIGLVGLILIQQGKGADMGASFGAGASATLFGSSGAGNFLTRSTAVLAVGFFALSLIIGNLSANHTKSEDAWNNLGAGAAQVTEQVTEDAKQQEPTEDKIPD